MKLSIFKASFVALSLVFSAVEGLAAQPDCAAVCARAQRHVQKQSKDIEIELKLWESRLGLKGDVVRYSYGSSAAEELLRFMAPYYIKGSPANSMDPGFLTYLMVRCFPEGYIDLDYARMSSLVKTTWVAKTLKIEKDLFTCK